MSAKELKELHIAITALSQKVDRLSQLMLPTEESPVTDLDIIEQQIEEFGLDPVQALKEAGILKPKSRRGRKPSAHKQVGGTA